MTTVVAGRQLMKAIKLAVWGFIMATLMATAVTGCVARAGVRPVRGTVIVR
jgi:hypothetical protein